MDKTILRYPCHPKRRRAFCAGVEDLVVAFVVAIVLGVAVEAGPGVATLLCVEKRNPTTTATPKATTSSFAQKARSG
ncbi:MAG TPA: hypothetical protein VFQ00_09660 [Terriglobales bacterium]|nr:hypothetical protein [Terriglobales bacterium]